MGTTLDALQDEGASVRYVIAIEGYSRLICDADSDADLAAVLTAWAGTPFTGTPLPGLEIDGELVEEFEPWETGLDAPSMKFIIQPDDADTFATTVFASRGLETKLAQPFDSTDGTLTVLSTGVFPASGDLFIGGRQFGYTAKPSGTQFTLAAGGAGKVAPFPADGGGSNMPPNIAVPGYQGDVGVAPVVQSLAKTWQGKWIGLWVHRNKGGVLDTKAQAQLLFAGKITDIQDSSSGATVIEAADIRESINSSVLLHKQFRGYIAEGIYLQAGDAFVATTYIQGTAKTSSTLTVVSSGAAGSTQINAGLYSAHDLQGRMGKWLANASGTIGDWSVAIQNTPDGHRFRFSREHSGTNLLVISVSATRQEIWQFLGYDPKVGEDGTFVISHGGHGARVRITGTKVPLRLMPIQRWTHDQASYATQVGVVVTLRDVEGDWWNHTSWLPPQLKNLLPNTTDDWSFVRCKGSMFMCRKVSNTTLDTFFATSYLDASMSLPSTQELLPNVTIDQTDYEPYAIEQVVALSGKFSDILTRVLASVDGLGANHATYDSFPAGIGCGVPWTLLGQNWLDTVISAEEGSSVNSVLVVLDKPTSFSDVFSCEFLLRFCWMVFAEGGLQIAVPQTPSAINADLTIGVDDRAGAADDPLRTVTTITQKYLRNHLIVAYERDLSDRYKYTIEVYDNPSITTYGLSKPVTIKARNCARASAASSTTVWQMALHLATRMLLFYSKPMRTFRVPVDPGTAFQATPGDTVSFSDDYVRHPTTGARGVSNLACTVMATRIQFGGGGIGAEIDLLYTDEERVYPMAPTASSDETYTSGGFTNGWDPAAKKLKLKQHDFTRAAGSTKDVNSFAVNDKIRVYEVDPAGAADTFLDTISAVDTTNDTITLTNGFGAGGRPAFSGSKFYRVTYDDFAAVDGTAQELVAYLADDVDGLIVNTENPNQYGEESTRAFAVSAPTTFPDNPSAVQYAEGRPMHTGLVRDGIVNINNFLNYRSAVCTPPHVGNKTILSSGITQFDVFGAWPIYVGQGYNPHGRVRKLNISPMFYSSSGGHEVKVRATLSLFPPRGTYTGGAATWAGNVKQNTWSTTSTTLQHGTVWQVTPIVWPDTGLCWLTIECATESAILQGVFLGFSQFWLGPLE